MPVCWWCWPFLWCTCESPEDVPLLYLAKHCLHWSIFSFSVSFFLLVIIWGDRGRKWRAFSIALSSVCSSDLRNANNELLLIMWTERRTSAVSRKSLGLNLHPVRFSCGQLFEMAAGEGKTERSKQFSGSYAACWPCPQCMDMFTARGKMWAEQVTLRVYFLGIPPWRQGSTSACSDCICSSCQLLPWHSFCYIDLLFKWLLFEPLLNNGNGYLWSDAG